MSRTARELVAAATFFALFAGFAWLATDFGPRARMIPLPLAIVGMALSVVQIVLALRGHEQQRMKIIEVDVAALPPADPATGQAPALPAGADKSRSEWTAYAIVVGLTVLILAAGPVIAIFVFTGAYFARTRLYSVVRSLIYAALFTGGVHLLFFTTLQIEPYYGLLAPLMAQFR